MNSQLNKLVWCREKMGIRVLTRNSDPVKMLCEQQLWNYMEMSEFRKQRVTWFGRWKCNDEKKVELEIFSALFQQVSNLRKECLLMILNISIQLNVWHERQFRMSPIITTTTQHRLTIARSWRCIFGSADLMDALCTSSVKRHRSVPSSHSIEILFSAPSSKLSIRLSAPSSVNLLVNSVFHHSFRKITEWIAFTRRMCARV